MKRTLSLLSSALLVGLFSCTDHEVPNPGEVIRQTVIENLKSPIGLAFNAQDQIFVTEAGTGNQDARVSMIMNGQAMPVVTGMQSVAAEGTIEGIGHLYFHGDSLYILHGIEGMIYSVKTSSLNPNQPLAASSITRQFVRPIVDSLKLVTPLNSNVYNLTAGPNGDLYITDAGTNIVLKREKGTGKISLFAKIPKVTPTAEAVPTGIVFDGQKFLVTALSGGPFIDGTSKIFQIDLAGNVSEYKTGFTTLTDITLSGANKPVVVQLARFAFAPTPGFVPNSGNLLSEDGKAVVTGFSMPTDIENKGTNKYYVLNHGSGKLEMVSW